MQQRSCINSFNVLIGHAAYGDPEINIYRELSALNVIQLGWRDSGYKALSEMTLANKTEVFYLTDAYFT